MRLQKEEASDRDWNEDINRQQANTWLFFKLRKITSCRLLV